MGIRKAIEDAVGFVTGDKAKKAQAEADIIAERQAAEARAEEEAAAAQQEEETGETLEEADDRRRKALLSGVKTSPLGIQAQQETVGRTRLLG